MTAYTPYILEKPLKIDRLYSVHYFEYTSSYAFAGESHNFWEFLYVDKGTVRITCGEQVIDLTRGQMVFHQPGEFHALAANGVVAPNLIVVSFPCDSPAMDFFRKRITSTGAEERLLLARIVSESRNIFSSPLDNPAPHILTRRESVPFGSEQLLATAVEELLIRLIRRGDAIPIAQMPHRRTEDRVEHITEYLEQRLDQHLTLHQICRDNLIGRAQLERCFHEQTGGGVIDYFNQLKINAARHMIREGRLNFTQIAEKLGFQSVHYFSRRFRRSTGMSPSEYAESVKMLSDISSVLRDDRANNM
ncbi:MAG: helix-turn-helix transcriptional regulator [Oscillospiraceae bacterium]|nr:helix-turn-helix transcriptional regulator [Oscillospiraceae bacterium]